MASSIRVTRGSDVRRMPIPGDEQVASSNAVEDGTYFDGCMTDADGNRAKGLFLKSANRCIQLAYPRRTFPPGIIRSFICRDTVVINVDE